MRYALVELSQLWSATLLNDAVQMPTTSNDSFCPRDAIKYTMCFAFAHAFLPRGEV